MEKVRFPNKLRMFRRISGLSQKKVAIHLGLSNTSPLSKWEKGIQLPGLLQVFRLCRIYKAKPEELFDDLFFHMEIKGCLFANDCRHANSEQSDTETVCK